MYSSLSSSDRSAMPPMTVATPTASTVPLLILGDPSPLTDSLAAQLEALFPASPLIRTTWLGDALDRLAAQRSDTVFLSDRLPQRQALACARAIKALWPQIRTILISERRLTLSQLLRAEGVDACLAAPLSAAQVQLVLEVVG